ncbi:MAG: FAD-binding protein, partial [Deltaproteobacteria bacterium]|nr:FAD-binding protein [Deltaproteobacteria bacterium]
MNLLKLTNIFSHLSNNSFKQFPGNHSAQDTPDKWDDEADVVVVGFGGAGACAAIEASDAGADVMIIERFNGGGATNASGGVVYTGGGTRYQKEAGFDDTPENMFNYLRREVKGVVKDSTLKTFCEQSNDNLTWLEKHGVPFEASFCPYKTSYPSDRYYLYYSGNESFAPFIEDATPAPRGHRARGKGISGQALFKPLKEAVRERGIRIRTQSKATRLITDENGNVTGLELSSIEDRGIKTRKHMFLNFLAYKLRYLIFFYPPAARYFKKAFENLEKKGRKIRVRARKGVIISAGGFVFNREMIKEHAPAYRRAMSLGTLGDDGSGIKLGMDVGGATAEMNRVSAWRFINPPEAFIKGILVDRRGERICNEMYYGAQTAELMVEKHRDEGFLIIGSDTWKKAHRDILPDKAKFFQTMWALTNLYYNNKKARSIKALSKKCGIDEAGLRATLQEYNDVASSGKADPKGKMADFVKPIKPPYYAIDCSLGAPLFNCPTITLGGLVVDEEAGEVKRKDGSVIRGLYA